MKTKLKVTRKEKRRHLEQFHLAVELVKVINHFFPDLIHLLKQTQDPRNQGYITYPNVILLMTRILSSIFYISSMRKTSQKFNSDVAFTMKSLMRQGRANTTEAISYFLVSILQLNCSRTS